MLVHLRDSSLCFRLLIFVIDVLIDFDRQQIKLEKVKISAAISYGEVSSFVLMSPYYINKITSLLC